MNRILIKSGNIMSMDSAIGDLAGADILVEDDRILAVAKNIKVEGADIIDASRMIVVPGLINGHLHTWQTGLRGLAADWTVAQYMQAMHRGLATLYRPDDIYVGNLPGETLIWVVTKTEVRWAQIALAREALAEHAVALRCGLDRGVWEGEGRQHCLKVLAIDIEKAPAGGDPLLFRPYGAGGVIDDRLMSPFGSATLCSGGYTCVLWNVLPGDWRDPDGWVDAALIGIDEHPWSVVVLHDVVDAALPRLDEFIGELRDRDPTWSQEFPDDCTPVRDGSPTSSFGTLGSSR
jgi:hypothetical protein